MEINNSFNPLHYDQEVELSFEYLDLSWRRDQLLLQAVQTGNYETINQLIITTSKEKFSHHFYGNPNFKDNMLRTRKNGLIIRNTVCRIGAGFGGVPPLYLHYISEKYVELIEKSNDMEYLLKDLTKQMFKEYCGVVNHFSFKQYSKPIQEVCHYISQNMSEQLSLEEIAKVVHLNSAHLSRKFKSETGYSLTEYINKQKIELSKLMFERGQDSVTEVAHKLGFNSSSYFSKTFSKLEGISPKKYMNQVFLNKQK